IALPATNGRRDYHDVRLTVAVGPSMQRWLIEEALERGHRWGLIERDFRSWRIAPPRTHADTASELTVLQLDAHADSRDSYQGSRFNHACVMARVKECCPIVQAGVRSMAACELSAVDPNRMFYAKDIIHARACIDDLLDRLSPRVYITIDLDVFDPAFMPATGTPEPGGLSWYEVLALLKAVCERSHVVGFDIVELCPLPNHRGPDFLAAKLIYTLLSYRFQKKRAIDR
ncbi:MAG: arginase family protein, partial [Planctomycetes bacterium]|nr:arginase family protein [Planctomycetota bacterium]